MIEPVIIKAFPHPHDNDFMKIVGWCHTNKPIVLDKIKHSEAAMIVEHSGFEIMFRIMSRYAGMQVYVPNWTMIGVPVKERVRRHECFGGKDGSGLRSVLSLDQTKRLPEELAGQRIMMPSKDAMLRALRRALAQTMVWDGCGTAEITRATGYSDRWIRTLKRQFALQTTPCRPQQAAPAHATDTLSVASRKGGPDDRRPDCILLGRAERRDGG